MLRKKFSKKQIKRQFVEAVISSTRIEGIHFTENELRKLKCQKQQRLEKKGLL